MNGLFNLDNPVMKFLTKVCDVMILSLLWFVCSIPIITLGASTTALYYASVKVVRRDRGYVAKEFFKSFRLNLGQGIIMSLVFGLASLLFITNIQFASKLEGDFGTILHIIYIVMCVVVWGTAEYAVPILSRFTMKITALFKTSFFLFFKHFPQSILVGFLIALSIWGSMFYPIVIVFVPSTCAIVVSLVMEPILKRYTPHEEEENRKDEWYLE